MTPNFLTFCAVMCILCAMLGGFIIEATSAGAILCVALSAVFAWIAARGSR